MIDKITDQAVADSKQFISDLSNRPNWRDDFPIFKGKGVFVLLAVMAFMLAFVNWFHAAIFVPATVAMWREHPNRQAIYVLSGVSAGLLIFTTWSMPILLIFLGPVYVIGWIAALVWSFTNR
jgi:hypothetical protein